MRASRAPHAVGLDLVEATRAAPRRPAGKGRPPARRCDTIEAKLPDGRLRLSTAAEHALGAWDLAAGKRLRGGAGVVGPAGSAVVVGSRRQAGRPSLRPSAPMGSGSHF